MHRSVNINYTIKRIIPTTVVFTRFVNTVIVQVKKYGRERNAAVYWEKILKTRATNRPSEFYVLPYDVNVLHFNQQYRFVLSATTFCNHCRLFERLQREKVFVIRNHNKRSCWQDNGYNIVLSGRTSKYEIKKPKKSFLQKT